MSTTPNNNNRFFNRIANTYIHSDSINETTTTPAPDGDGSGPTSTWVDSLIQLDRVFSGTLLRLCYNLIDIVLLSLGLYYGARICGISNALAVISILILVFSGLGLAYILLHASYINAGQIHLISGSVTAQSKQDILYSLLLVQSATNSKISRPSISLWYENYERMSSNIA
ncbi:unnamed protein product [Adineta steineri]|uniref:Uncharacterized protein n=1 Tax=Adineta steineri TaxID=433720 RepID=A0A815DAH7_9BILA|nr:unnamed protein product [Adineta steineri]